MGFVAIHSETGKRIDLTQYREPRNMGIKSGDCHCQLCKEPMVIKAGFVKSAHFAHYPNTECRSEYGRHPESRFHRAAKEFVATMLREELPEYSEAQVELEVTVPEAKREADIMITFPMGWREAHEIQLSSISIAELEERTNAYWRAGIDVIWWLGKSADTESNRLWCIHNIGFAVSIGTEEQLQILRRFTQKAAS